MGNNLTQDQMATEFVSLSLADLDQVPPTVTSLTLDYSDQAVPLPEIGPGVKTLILRGGRFSGQVRFPEGLESIELHDVGGTMPMVRWIYPTTLKSFKAFTVNGHLLDLRSVTAPEVTASNPSKWPRFYFSDTVESLDLDSRYSPYFPVLPHYLRKLKIHELELDIKYDKAVYPTVEELETGYVMESIPVGIMFPNIEKYTIRMRWDPVWTPLDFPKLRELTFSESSSREAIEIIAPELERLTIWGYDRHKVQLDPKLNTLGATLTSISLYGQGAEFPEAEEWERLSSVTVAKTSVVLPFIRWLDTLELDRPSTTNGVDVSNLEEYREAWGLSGRSNAKLAARY